MLAKIRAKRQELAAKMEKISATMDAGAHSAEDAAAFDAAEAEFNALGQSLKRAERLAEHKAELAEPAPSLGASAIVGAAVRGPEASREFESLDQFMTAALGAVTGRRQDQRLEYGEPGIRAEQNMGDGPSGGFMVPKQFRGELLSVDQAGGAVRQRARIIPAGSPPDAEISMPALDQSSAENMFGGVTVSWIAEGAAKPATDAKLREVRLAPKEVAATVILTDKLLRNWEAAGATLSDLLRKAMAGAEDQAFVNGSGVGRPLGFITSGGALTVNRTTAGTIKYADLVAMEGKMVSGASPVWITTQLGVSKLRLMEDSASHLIWSEGNVTQGFPPTLLGYPVVVLPRMPVLGAKGDICLVDLSYYLIKDGSGPFIAASEHVYFATNKTVIKAFWNVDGAPWVNSAIVQENGDTQSPFVLLDLVSA